MPIHLKTNRPYTLGRVYPERLVEPAALVDHAAELVRDVQMVPTAVGDVGGCEV